MNVLTVINIILTAIFALCYAYQFVYIPLSPRGRKKPKETSERLSLAVLICARNEKSVIKRVIDSLDKQDYPREKYRVFVAADNCTDETAKVARECGAVVYERTDADRVGKGYAMDFLIRSIKRDFRGAYDAYIVLDADNILSPDYLTEINKMLREGYDVITSYRASSNFGDNWVSAGQGMCFLRDMVLLNRARHAIGGSTFVSGTGYAFTDRLCESFGGAWPFVTLTEDCEFTMYCSTEGVRMGYCDTARFYDEQPTSFRQSFKQRLRWCRGGIQVFKKYMKRMIGSLFKRHSFSSFDMAMCMAPAYLVSLAVVLVNTVGAAVSLAFGEDPIEIAVTIATGLFGAYLAFLVFGISLTVTEWDALAASDGKKIFYMFTFPIFMLTFVPITFIAFLKPQGTWSHTERKNESE